MESTVSKEILVELWRLSEAPCLSLYQPTHRRPPGRQGDPIRYRNLVKSLEASLAREYAAREAAPLLEPFRALNEDRDFWNRTHDGMAVLGAPGFFRVFRLQRPVPELAIVAETFHAKPLLRIVQSADRYHVLGVSRQEVKLFEGNRDALDEVGLAPDVPRTIADALGSELTEPYLKVSSYGMGAGGPAMHHATGSKSDEIDLDRERFFRAVDRAILAHHSRPSGLPLIIAALPEHHNLFREVSHNPFLVPAGIDVHPDAVPIDALRERAWSVMLPHYLERLAAWTGQFGAARARGLAAADVADISAAVVAGRVATLLIEAERHVAGRIDRASGRIERADLDHPEVNDLLDDLGELAMQHGGDVVVVPAERMPTDTGAAAIYRY
jgi:hypothetical protein